LKTQARSLSPPALPLSLPPYRKIKRGEFKFHYPMWINVSPEAKDPIKKLLVVVIDPIQKLTPPSPLFSLCTLYFCHKQ